MSAPDLAQRKPRQRERGYDIFQSGLIDGVIEAGQFLTHREIGVLTGLPLRGVRELVARLEGEGLLTVTPQRGVKVADVDVSLIRNAFQLRRFLEREAVMEYCASASDSELAARRSAHETVLRDAMESAPDAAMIERFHAADRGLHGAIIDSLGNPLIADTYRINAIKIRLIRRTQIRVERFMAQTMREHLAVIAACEERDRFAAAEAMGAHIDSTMRRVIGVD